MCLIEVWFIKPALLVKSFSQSVHLNCFTLSWFVKKCFLMFSTLENSFSQMSHEIKLSLFLTELCFCEICNAKYLLVDTALYQSSLFQTSFSTGISRYPCFSRISPKICHIISYHWSPGLTELILSHPGIFPLLIIVQYEKNTGNNIPTL